MKKLPTKIADIRRSIRRLTRNLLYVILSVTKNLVPKGRFGTYRLVHPLARSFTMFRMTKVFSVIQRQIQRNSAKKRLLLGSLSVLLLTFIFRQTIGSVKASWFDENWFYRQNVQIAGSIIALTDYQVSFTLDTATLITAGKMKSDCSDLRITDPNGKLLPLWVEEGSNACNTATTNIWTKVPSVHITGTTLYIYYGNPTAISVSNGKKVFEQFDTFSQSTLDGSLWSTTGTVSISSGTLILSPSSKVVAKNVSTDASGLGKLIFRAKTAATNVTGGLVGFSSTQSLSSSISSGESSYLGLGNLEEKLNDFTTNLISYHKLEETNTQMSTPSAYLDTGKLNQAVSMYGNTAQTSSSFLAVFNGSQISGTNYQYYNPNQGTVSFWVKPSWNGNDGKDHFFYSRYNYGRDLQIFKSSASILTVYFTYNAPTVRAMYFNVASWTAGTWYHVLIRWDADNAVSGSNYAELYVNGALANQYTSAWTPPTPTYPIANFIGARSFNSDSTLVANSPAQALIDDFGIFDRVITSSEIANIYNSGTGQEAGSVADPSLKFYAKMDGSGTLSPVTYNLGANVDQTAYNASTNTNGNALLNGNMEAATAGAPTSWTAVGSPTLANAATASILSDTRSQKISVTGVSKGIKQAVTVVAASNWTLNGWLKSDGTNIAQVRIRDATNGTDLATLPVTASTYTAVNSSFKAPAGCISIEIYVESGTAASYDLYVDNLSLTPSLVDNGGMEGGANPPESWVQETNATVISDTTPHTGTNHMKVTAGAANVGASQAVTLVNDTWYLVSGWAKATSGDTASITVDTGAGVTTTIGTTTATSYTQINGIFKSVGTAGNIYLRGVANTDVVWFDDISVIPLDNVAASLVALTPVADAKSNPPAGGANPLSNQGGTSGVTSNTSGVLNNAYTFDGSTGFLRQKDYTFTSIYGPGSYSSNTYTDTYASFTPYKSANPAAYMLLVTNSDNTTSWGYIGSGGATNVVNVYTTKAESVAGWNGTSPTGKTPIAFEIRKTDYQITGNLTIGAWVNGTTASRDIISKYSSQTNGSYSLALDASSKPIFTITNGTTAQSVTATSALTAGWHHVVAVYSPSTSLTIYVDGVSDGTNTSSIYASIADSYQPFQIGYGANGYFNGSIDSPFVITSVLTDDQVKTLFEYSTLTTSHTGTKTNQINTSTPTNDTNYHIYALNSLAASSTISQDGAAAFSTSTTNLPNSSQYVRLENSDPTNNLTVDWIAVTKNTATAPSAGSPASEEKSIGPTAYWKFDEGNSNIAHDSTSNRSDGTITGSTWQDESMCVSGKCLKFNGSSDNIAVTPVIKNIQSVSFWVKPNSITSGAIIDLDGGTHKITFSSGAITAAGFTAPIYYINGLATTSPVLSANVWTHVEITTATPFNSTASNTIAQSSTTYLNGFLDDVKIFGYARSAAQIKADYNSKSSAVAKGNSVILSGANGSSGASLSNGLVGYWKMDEATWSGTLADVVDSSGNGNTGTAKGATGGAAYPLPAKFGNGGYFDGVDDYVNAGSGTSLNITGPTTLAVWFNTNTLSLPKGSRIFLSDGTNGAYFALNTNNLATPKVSLIIGGTQRNLDSNTPSSINTWNHAVVTWDGDKIRIYVNGVLKNTSPSYSGALNTSGVKYIGRYANPGFEFSGLLDDFRIYNRALSPAEVQQLYNWAPGPVAQYNFEEGSGLYAQDTSGNSNTGTLGVGSSAPTWTAGKFGKALKFDGNDYVSVANTVSVNTVAFWVKPTTNTASMINLTATQYIAAASGTISAANFTSPIYYINGQVTASPTLTANVWNHIAVTTTAAISANTITIGKANSAYTTGLIDQVQIYNYVRTQKQIIQDMDASSLAVGTDGQPRQPAMIYFKFDEGYGTTTNNSGSTGSVSNGTLNSSSWNENGKFNRGVTVSGSSGSNVSIPDFSY